MTSILDSIILRTLRYSDHDLIGHAFTLERGRVGVIARRSRGMKTSLGGRLEPFSRVKLTVREGRGELLNVASIELVELHPVLRESYERQRVGAAALDVLGALGSDGGANPEAFDATCELLGLLDDPGVLDPARAEALQVTHALRMLTAFGVAPSLDTCVRCSEPIAVDGVVAFSPFDGGVVCSRCRTSMDRPVAAVVLAGVRRSLTAPLDQVEAGEWTGPALKIIVGSMVASHAPGARRPRPTTR